MKTQKENYQPIKWESVKDLANRTPFSPDSIYEMASKGKIPCRKIKGKWLFDPKEVDEFLSQGKFQKTENIEVNTSIKNIVATKRRMRKNSRHSGQSEETAFQVSGRS